MVSRTVVLDNGGGIIKAGFAGEDEPRLAMTNSIAQSRNQLQTYVGSEIDEFIGDHSQLLYSRPADRGYICNWEALHYVWSRALGGQNLGIRPQSCALLVTDPPFCPPSLQEQMNELVFETYQFDSYSRMPAAELAFIDMINQQPDSQAAKTMCGMVIDSGFSFSHAVPIIGGKLFQHGVKRVNVGGKVLTNYLKEIVSYRHIDLHDDPWLVNKIKESFCYVSQDFEAELSSMQQSVGPRTFEGTRSKQVQAYRSELQQQFGRAKSAQQRKSLAMLAKAKAFVHDYRPRIECILPNYSSSFLPYARGSIKDRFKALVDEMEVHYQKEVSGSDCTPEHVSQTEESAAQTETTASDALQPLSGSVGEEVERLLAEQSNLPVIPLTSERICVPEALFSPSDLGIRQCGITEATVNSIAKCPAEVQTAMYASIWLTGGNTRFKGFHQRFPILSAWKGGSILGAQPEFPSDYCVSKFEYEEQGHRIVSQMFAPVNWGPEYEDTDRT